jgi:hypothetical protein
VDFARNLGIVALIALGITVLPGGGTATDTVLTAINLGFLAAIGIFAYRLHRENGLAIMTLTDGWKAILYGSMGVIALMIAGADEMFETGLGTLAWIAFVALGVFGLVSVVRETRGYA